MVDSLENVGGKETGRSAPILSPLAKRVFNSPPLAKGEFGGVLREKSPSVPYTTVRRSRRFISQLEVRFDSNQLFGPALSSP